MKLSILLTAAAVAAAVLAATASGSSRPSGHGCQQARAGIRFYVAATRRYDSQHDQAAPDAAEAAASSPSCRYVRWAARRWRSRANAARASFQEWFAAEMAKWACIHSHEGSWSDEGLPQMGGLQFDPGFQATYGAEFLRRWGDAGNWPVWAQLLAADRAYYGYDGYGPRYYTPWPNTARMCGLL